MSETFSCNVNDESHIDQSSLKKTNTRKGRHFRAKVSVTTYCICGYGDGDMIGCDGESSFCPGKKWYHLECLGMDREPRGTWYCPDCAERETKKINRKRKQVIPAQLDLSHLLDEKKFVVSKKELKIISGKASGVIVPLKVEAAERQSRDEMELLRAKAKLLSFNEKGQVVQCAGNTGDFPNGLCNFRVETDHFTALQSLHRIIVRALSGEQRLTPWAGVGESDQRKRGYAFLPSTFGKFGKSALIAGGINFYAAEKKGSEAKNDENANWKSCIRLKSTDITEDHEMALKALIKKVAHIVPEKYKKCVTLEQLHAIQPNLHNGLDHLPAHLDSPLNDGFGVVIVTVCVHQSAQILLLSNKSSKSWLIDVNEGDTYVLCSDARNAYDHGVICPLDKRRTALRENRSDGQTGPQKKKKSKRGSENVGRESLNLRFGLHGSHPGTPFYVGDEMPLVFK